MLEECHVRLTNRFVVKTMLYLIMKAIFILVLARIIIPPVRPFNVYVYIT